MRNITIKCAKEIGKEFYAFGQGFFHARESAKVVANSKNF